jgi:hypothetical protein
MEWLGCLWPCPVAINRDAKEGCLSVLTCGLSG